MKVRTWGAAIFAAFLFVQGASAQDVTLTARDGGITLTGTLQGYDGELYRIETQYGLLTVDGEGVLCEGPGCPDLTAPKATVRLVGAPDAGAALIPPLIEAFATTRGFRLERGPDAAGYAATIRDPVTDKVLAEVSFQPMAPEPARAALVAGQAELMVAATVEPGLGSRPLAMDALIPIMAADNPTPRISSVDLARALAGEARNWADVGGPDMPLVLHALEPGADLQRALEARLGRRIVADVVHPDEASLAAAVARDPWALAVTGRAAQGGARRLTLTDSCGFPLLPTPLGVKAEDYPLTLPVHLLTPRRRLPLFVREFMDFLATAPAQAAVAGAGYVDRAPERQPMTADGLRLINAIQGAGDDIALPDLKRLVAVMAGADRLSLTFRFQDGSTTLDAASQGNLDDLAQLLEAGQFRGETLVLAGFSDGSGAAAANLDLSLSRAVGVLAALRQAAPDLAEDALPRVEAFGEALPMACDTTVPGRRMNRRVEVWIRPATGSPAP